MKDLYKKIIKGITMVGIADLFVRLKYFILIPIFSKRMGAMGYGLWAQTMTTVTILLPVAMLGSDMGLMRFLPGKDKRALSENITSILSIVTMSSLLAGLLIIIFSGYIADSFFKSIKYISLIRLSGIYLFTFSLKELLLKILRIKGDFKKYSIYLSVESLLYIIVGSILALWGGSVFLILFFFTIINAVFLLVYLITIRNEIGFNTPRLSGAKDFFICTLPLIPITWFLSIDNIADRYIIGFFHGISKVGIYAAVYSISYFVINLFTAPILVVMQQVISELWNKGDFQIAKDLLNKCIKYTLYLTLPLIFGFWTISHNIIVLLTTKEFSGGAVIAPFILFGYQFFIIAAIIENVLLLKNRAKLILIIYMASAITNISLNLLLVPRIGILGAAIVTTLTFLVHMCLCIVSILKDGMLIMNWGFLARLLAASCLMLAVMQMISSTILAGIVFKVILGAALYFGSLYMLGIPKKEEILTIKAIIFESYLSRR